MMKRHGSSDSLGALISMCPASEEHGLRSSHMYSRDYESMLDGLDEEGCVEESGHVPEKKRRLSVDQVKALEKNFEVENKLEPERKVKLAQELGLQPRQVAVWFQNRRARWKTKQLERDYGVLKSNFDNLKHNYESLQLDKDSLLKQIKELKAKLKDENCETPMCIKEEALMSETHNITEDIEPITPQACLDGGAEDATLVKSLNGASDFKDGSSDSDSSAILNEDNSSSSPNASNSSCGGGFLQNYQEQQINCFNFTDNNTNNVYHPQFVKLEEHNFFSGEEACNFFSDEVAPTLNWNCSDHWNLMLTHQGDS